MAVLIKRFTDGSVLEFDEGAFDKWCVYLTRPGKKRYAPKDVRYFKVMIGLAKKYTPERVYADFVKLYNKTTREIDPAALKLIESVSSSYKDDVLLVDMLFSILYAGMVSEENKENTKLGKRVKRLGVYQCLFDNKSPEEAANFSKGMNWQKIHKLCEKYGF